MSQRITHRVELLDVAERVVKRHAVNVLGETPFYTASSTELGLLVCRLFPTTLRGTVAAEILAEPCGQPLTAHFE